MGANEYRLDIEAPTWASGDLTLSDITQDSVKLSWPFATDNVGVAGYRMDVAATGTIVETQNLQTPTVAGSVYGFTVTGLQADTTYDFTITAYDDYGNESTGLTAPTTTLRGVAIFVTEHGAGDNDGSSWDNAVAGNQLQLVIDGAVSGTQVWIAKGTYIPTGNMISSDPVTDHFKMKNNVAIYGGFAGNEDATTFDMNERDLDANETILSGDLNGDDESGGTNNDNAYHVFYHNNLGVNQYAVLDGVTITGGNAFYHNGHGGGMYNLNSSPTLRNVTISGNTAVAGGGGMYNESNSNPMLMDVTISGNMAVAGGGMFNNTSSPTLTKVTINGNKATIDGGGIYNVSGNPMLTKVTISGNTANNIGGGIYNVLGNPALTKVTISGNVASLGGGMGSIGGNPTLTNVVINGNTADGGGGMYNGNSGNPTLTNVTISGNTARISGGGVYNEDQMVPMYATALFGATPLGMIQAIYMPMAVIKVLCLIV